MFVREVRASGRRRSTYAVRSLLVVALVVLTALVYAAATAPGRQLAAQSFGAAQQLQQAQTIAPAIVTAIIWLQLAMVNFICPFLTAPLICDERRKGTLATLLTTPLYASQIIAGKLAGVLVQVVILILLSLPILLAIRVFGGVPADTIFHAASIILSSALMAATLGLCFSVWSRRASTAAVTTMGLLGLLYASPLLIAIATEGKLLLFFLSAPIALLSVSGDLFSAPLGIDDRTWWLNTLVNLGAAALFALIATGALRRLMVRVGAGSIEAAPARASRRGVRPSGACDSPSGSRSRTVGDHPVLWRELRGRLLTRPIVAGVVVLGAIAFLGWLHLQRDVDPRMAAAMVSIVVTIIATLAAASSAATAIPSERDSRTWEVLITTPLRPAAIIMGKFAGVLRRTGLVPLALTPYLSAVALFSNDLEFAGVPLLIALTCTPIVSIAAVGVLLGSRIRSSAGAAVTTTLVAAGFWLIVPVIILVLFEAIIPMARSSRTLEHVTFGFNPFVLLGTGFEGFDRSGGTYSFDGPGGSQTLPVYLLHCGVSIVVHMVIAASALGIAASTFNRVSGRPS